MTCLIELHFHYLLPLCFSLEDFFFQGIILIRHDICQQIYATAVFGPTNLRKKSITRDKIKSATKQRKCPKMAILRHLGVEMDN